MWGQMKALTETRKKMTDAGIEVSLVYCAGDRSRLKRRRKLGAEFIELHTGAFAESYFQRKRDSVSVSRKDSRGCSRNAGDLPELERFIAGAKHAHALGLKVNAGHGLNYENLALLHQVPHLVELNIGHSIVSRCGDCGLT